MNRPDQIEAPWTDEQVAALNRWQATGHVHPFTHDCGTVLRATADGWTCSDIGCSVYDPADATYPMVVQTWAWAFMADEPPPHPLDWLFAARGEREVTP